ncbi:MAG: family hydrolase [Thermomicrobiales bacterium]|jgi:D-glycero-D-manno-heptose 1,7-bisphosphate phosphatase|nr:family hydrolase [Thermomicrobiales bacterium]
MKRALFLDRDGTLVEPRHYPSRPDDLVLSPGIGPLLRLFQQSGWEMIVITNQSGIARGYFSERDLYLMHERLRQMLRVWGVELNAIQYCPHHVDGAIPHLAIACACRKPQPGMLLRAAAERDIDLPRSWMIGDILDDIEAGNRAGCRTVLVDLGTEQTPDRPEQWPRLVARSTADALKQIAFAEDLLPLSPPPPLFRPAHWYAPPTAARR